MLTLTELAKLVKSMRDAQKAYFKQTSWDNRYALLDFAKQLEKEVDEACSEILDTQGKLFE